MLFEIKSLAFGFSDKMLFHNLNLSLQRNEKIAIMGANGIGKTSLLRLIIGLYKPLSGEIKYNQKLIEQYKRRELGKAFAYIPQLAEVYPDLIASQFFDDLNSESTKDQLKILEIETLLDRPFKSLSGGEKQRILLASALSRQPQVILADELTQGVDPDFRLRFADCLNRYIKNYSASLLLVTHDHEWALKNCSAIFSLKEGELFKYE